MEFELGGNYGQVQNGKLVGPEGGVAGALEGNYYQAKRKTTAARARRINEAAKLFAAVMNGDLDPVFMKEAMNPTNEVFVEHLRKNFPALYTDESTGRVRSLRETMSVSDYQALYVDVLDRIYYGYYNSYPIVNKQLVRTHQLRDFRVVSRYLLDGVVEPLSVVNPSGGGGDAASEAPQRALSGPVPQDGATYPTTSNGPIQYQPKLYQAKTAVNWRAIVNDDLGIFRDLAERLAIAGNRGISKFITTQFFDANGPSATLYTTGYGNQITTANGAASNNPSLGVQGIDYEFR